MRETYQVEYSTKKELFMNPAPLFLTLDQTKGRTQEEKKD